MTYKLLFIPSSWKEWRKLDHSVRKQFQKKLAERLENPLIPSAKLAGSDIAYKIKLRSLGYRLVYEVDGEKIMVTVISVGRRDGDVYRNAEKRSGS